MTDSAILIQYKKDFILNLNDSKPQRIMASQINSSIGKGNLKVMLRSHSSANSRICIKNRDGSNKDTSDKNKEVYSREFLNAASFFNPKVAIPFASNMCYLHKDSFKYNKHSNTSDLLYNYSQSSTKFKNINVQLVLPGEVFDLKLLQTTINENSRKQLFSEREITLKKYREKFLKQLENSEYMQDHVSFSEKIISNYFKFIFKKIPFFISLFGRGSIAFCEKTTKKIRTFS